MNILLRPGLCGILLVLHLATGTGRLAHAQTPSPRKIDQKAIKELVRDGEARATLVNVWATWCIPCREEMPGLLRLKSAYESKGLRLVLVSADGADTPDSVVQASLAKLGVEFPTYVDADSSDEQFINGMNPDWSGALPASFLYDSTGALVTMMVGGKPFETFERAIRPLLH